MHSTKKNTQATSLSYQRNDEVLQVDDSPIIDPVWSDLSSCSTSPIANKSNHNMHKCSSYFPNISITAQQKDSSKGHHFSCLIKWLVALSVVFGVIGCVVGGIGIARWQALRKEIARLHEQIDQFEVLNNELKQTNAELTLQVDRLGVEVNKFADLSDNIKQYLNYSTARFEDVVDQANELFHNITQQMAQVTTINQNTKEALMLQLESEKREKYTSYTTMITSVASRDTTGGINNSRDWELVIEQIVQFESAMGNAVLNAEDFLNIHPFSSMVPDDSSVIPVSIAVETLWLEYSAE